MNDSQRNTRLSAAQVADVVARVADGEASVAGEARRLGVPRSTLRNAIARHDQTATPPEPGLERQEDGGFTITSEPQVGSVRLTEDDLLAAYKVDPDKHIIVRRRISAWGNEDTPNFFMRLDIIPKSLLTLPDEDRPKTKLPRRAKKPKGEPMRWAFVTDYHWPYGDWGLHQTSCEWLRNNPVDVLIHGGDVLNNGQWARHRSRPRFEEEKNEGIECAGGMFEEHREILGPDAEIIWVPGNHDQWIEQRMIEDNSAALGTRGYRDEYDVLDLRRLLDTDGAGVHYIDEDWDLAYYALTDKLTALHGPGTGQNVAKKVFDSLTGSAIYGHTHHGKFTYKTRHDPATQTTESHVAIEAFMMARHHKGMGYAGQPDWTQGFVYGAAWEDDGYFTAAPAFYNDAPNGGSLLLADGSRYAATIDKFGKRL